MLGKAGRARLEALNSYLHCNVGGGVGAAWLNVLVLLLR